MEAGPGWGSSNGALTGPPAFQRNTLCPYLGLPKGSAALPTCPCLQVQLFQHNVEKEEDGLHKLGDGVGISRAPGKRERARMGLMANSGPGEEGHPC